MNGTKNTSIDLCPALLGREVRYGKGSTVFARRGGGFGRKGLGRWLAWTASLERRTAARETELMMRDVENGDVEE